MSQNFFAALDDSGDEGPSAPAKTNAKKREPKAAKKPVTEPNKHDERRRPNNNDRNTKGGRGTRAPARDGKRAYDRRSGTGRGKEIKKGGGGARNWGSDKEDAKKMEGKIDETEVQEEKPVTEPVEGEETLKENPAEAEPEPEPEPQPEDNTMTYAEYMASKAKKDDNVGVREVENEFKNLKPKVAVEEDFFVLGGGKQKKSKKKKEESKKAVEVGFRVVNPNAGGRGEGRGRGGREGRGRGGRDGRGRGREGRGEGRGGRDGRGGRGQGRGGRGGPAINVQDEKAFPSL